MRCKPLDALATTSPLLLPRSTGLRACTSPLPLSLQERGSRVWLRKGAGPSFAVPCDLPGDAGLRLLHRLAGREPGRAVVQRVAYLPAVLVGDRLHEGAQAGRVLALATARPAAGLVRANLPDAENVGETAQDQRPRPLAALEIGDRRDSGGGGFGVSAWRVSLGSGTQDHPPARMRGGDERGWRSAARREGYPQPLSQAAARRD